MKSNYLKNKRYHLVAHDPANGESTFIWHTTITPDEDDEFYAQSGLSHEQQHKSRIGAIAKDILAADEYDDLRLEMAWYMDKGQRVYLVAGKRQPLAAFYNLKFCLDAARAVIVDYGH